MDNERFPKARHIENIIFTPTSYHHNEYQLQKDHAESILRAVWLLTFNEWCQFFIEHKQLRDHPPICTGRWVTRKDRQKPFQLGNIRCGTSPEPGQPLITTYKINAKGKWVEWYSTRNVRHS